MVKVVLDSYDEMVDTTIDVSKDANMKEVFRAFKQAALDAGYVEASWDKVCTMYAEYGEDYFYTPDNYC